MSIIRYKVSDRSGKMSEVSIEAENPQEAVSKLKQQGLMPITILGYGGKVTRSKGRGPKFNALDFTGRLAPLLRSHVQLARALAIIEEGYAEGEGKYVVGQIKKGLHEGKKFSQLIKDQGNYFPPIYSNLISSGEESGLLTETVHELLRFMTQRKELREFLIKNSIYPVLIVTVTLGVSLFLLFVIIPKFADTISSAGRELPEMIGLMLGIGDTIAFLWWLWVGIALGAAFLVFKVKTSVEWKARWDQFMLTVPVIKNFIIRLENAMFFRTLGMLTQNHIHLLPAVRSSIDVIQNKKISSSLAHVPEALKKGEKISATIHESPYIPFNSIQLVRIGEESGHLSDMIVSVAEMSETAMKESIEKALALFVPCTILVLAVVVAFVVISIFMAILQFQSQ